MRNAIFWVTVASGVVAAYLMIRRGERLNTVAHESIEHPIGSLLRETKLAAS